MEERPPAPPPAGPYCGDDTGSRARVGRWGRRRKSEARASRARVTTPNTKNRETQTRLCRRPSGHHPNRSGCLGSLLLYVSSDATDEAPETYSFI